MEFGSFELGLVKALAKVELAARAGLEEMAREIVSDTKAGLERSDPDAAGTVALEDDGAQLVIDVGAEDAGFIEFGTPTNDAQPFLRPAIQRARAKAEITFRRHRV